ncbi:vigilin [Nephila pilipes]|uniref:Vigilin n=1 Tax=Nephila pilipes TaxID=299642 RepID=A0A8X6P4L8_NEPPI|nr:vigilin [Nephila pilipes]
MPLPDVQSDTITLRGEQAKLSPALTLVYSKANSVKTEHIDISNWLHKYITGNKEDVREAKKCLLEFSNEKQPDWHTAEIKANPEQHKFLIGKNRASIKKVCDRTGTRIIFPNENDDDKSAIIIIGRKEKVEAAKNELNSLIAQFKDSAKATTEIDPKYHRYFVIRGAEVLKQISNDYGCIIVSFLKIGSNSSKVVLKGIKNFLEPVKQRLNEIVEDLKAMVIVECIISQKHHPTILGIRDSKMQNMRRQFNVIIKLHDREKPEDADKGTMNGDDHADGLEAEFHTNFEAQKDELKKHCRLEDQPNPGGLSYVVPDRRSRPTGPTCRQLWKQAVNSLTEDSRDRRHECRSMAKDFHVIFI